MNFFLKNPLAHSKPQTQTFQPSTVRKFTRKSIFKTPAAMFPWTTSKIHADLTKTQFAQAFNTRRGFLYVHSNQINWKWFSGVQIFFRASSNSIKFPLNLASARKARINVKLMNYWRRLYHMHKALANKWRGRERESKSASEIFP